MATQDSTYSFKIEATGTEEFRRRMDDAAASVRRTGDAADTAGGSTRNLGNIVGQAGFQLQDFAVQVQGGTSALTALSQQGSQFLGLFGTGGAIAGAVLAVGALAAGFLGIGENAKEAQKSAEDAFKGMTAAAEATRKVVADINDLFATTAQRAATAFNTRVGQLRADARTNLDIFTQRNEGNALELVQAQAELADREAAVARRRADTFARTGSRVSDRDLAEDREIEALRRRVEGIRIDISRTSDRIGELTDAYQRLERAGFATGEEFGPDLPPTVVTGRRAGGGGAARAPAAEQFGPGIAEFRASQQIERAWEQSSQRAAASLDRLEERSAGTFDRIGQTALDRIGQGLVSAFTAGSGAAINFGGIARAALASVGTDLVRGASAAVFSGGGGGGGGFSFNGLLGRIGGATDLGNLGFLQGTSLAGLLNTPILGGAANAAATNSAIAASGTFGPATPSAVAAAGGGNVVTLGGFLGGVGAGFGAGQLVGGLVSSARGTVGPGSTIGSAGGALAGAAIGSIIPGVGTLIGGLVGGAAGGGLGGLFGPTRRGLESRSGGAVYFAPDASGRLVITSANGKRWDGAGATAEVQAQLDQLNAAVSARGLSFSADGFDQIRVGQVGFGQAAQRAGAPMSLQVDGLAALLRSADANTNTAIASARNRGGGLDAILSAADFVREVFEPLSRLAQPVDQFAESLRQVEDRFGEATRRAQELGLQTDRLNAARDREIERLRLPREISALRTIQGQQSALTGFLDEITVAGASPQNALLAAQQQFGDALSAARAAGLAGADLSRVVTAGRGLVAAGDAFYATGPGAADLRRFVSSSVSNLGAQFDLPAFGGSLDAAVERITGLTDEVQLLRDEVSRLREELRGARLLRNAA